MGKTQSKRSVDITTEGKKTPEDDVVTGKLEKIDDLDQKQLNGGANPQESVETEKKDEDIENDKDLTTEKSVESAQEGGGDSNEEQNTTSTVNTIDPLQGESASAQEGNKVTDDNSPVTDDSKKSKKEKVKKKWSFRSISFGKKDKQKPTKTEEAAADNMASINGEPVAENFATEGVAEKVKNCEAGGDTETVTSPEKLENGDASDKELNGNGEMTPMSTPIDENTKGAISNEQPTNNITTETLSSDSTETNLTTATENNQTDKKIVATAILVESETEIASTIASNGGASENNGTDMLSLVDDMNVIVTDKVGNTVEASLAVADKIKSIPSVLNDGSDVDVKTTEPHQNGVSADGETTESKSQAEVTLQTENDVHTNKLVTITTTTSSPNAPFNNLDLNIESAKMENVTNSEQTDNSLFEGSDYASHSVQVNLTHAVGPISSVTDHDEIQKITEDFSRAVSVAESESQNPPPLPTSPPPSQMSVFAFNAKNRSAEEVCDAVVTVDTKATPEILPMSESENTAESPAEIESISPCIKSSTIDQIEANTGENILDVIQIPPEVLNKEYEKNTEIGVTTFKTNEESNYAACLTVDDLAMNEPFEKDLERISRNGEEMKVATGMIDEITEKAVEMISSQTKNEEFSEQKDTNLFFQEKSEKTDVNDIFSQKKCDEVGVMKYEGSVSDENSLQSDSNDMNLLNSLKSTDMMPNLPQDSNNVQNDECQVQSNNHNNEDIKKDCIVLCEKGIENITRNEI